jgi:SIS domain-containing protein
MTESPARIEREIRESIAVQEQLVGAAQLIADAARLIIATMRNGGKLIVFGNGGSAADAQHLSAELVGRYRQNRKAFPAIALTTDSSALTSISNDYGFRLHLLAPARGPRPAPGCRRCNLHERKFAERSSSSRHRQKTGHRVNRAHREIWRQTAWLRRYLFEHSFRFDSADSESAWARDSYLKRSD